MVIEFQCSKIFPCLTELSLLHPLADKPVDEGPLGVHQVKLVVEPGPGLHDGRGVGEAADCTVDFRKIPSRNHRRGLVVDSNLDEK